MANDMHGNQSLPGTPSTHVQTSHTIGNNLDVTQALVCGNTRMTQSFGRPVPSATETVRPDHHIMSYRQSFIAAYPASSTTTSAVIPLTIRPQPLPSIETLFMSLCNGPASRQWRDPRIPVYQPLYVDVDVTSHTSYISQQRCGNYVGDTLNPDFSDCLMRMCTSPVNSSMHVRNNHAAPVLGASKPFTVDLTGDDDCIVISDAEEENVDTRPNQETDGGKILKSSFDDNRSGASATARDDCLAVSNFGSENETVKTQNGDVIENLEQNKEISLESPDPDMTGSSANVAVSPEQECLACGCKFVDLLDHINKSRACSMKYRKLQKAAFKESRKQATIKKPSEISKPQDSRKVSPAPTQKRPTSPELDVAVTKNCTSTNTYITTSTCKKTEDSDLMLMKDLAVSDTDSSSSSSSDPDVDDDTDDGASSSSDGVDPCSHRYNTRSSNITARGMTLRSSRTRGRGRLYLNKSYTFSDGEDESPPPGPPERPRRRAPQRRQVAIRGHTAGRGRGRVRKEEQVLCPVERLTDDETDKSVDEKDVPDNQMDVPDDEKGVSDDEKGVPDDEKDVPDDEKDVPDTSRFKPEFASKGMMTVYVRLIKLTATHGGLERHRTGVGRAGLRRQETPRENGDVTEANDAMETDDVTEADARKLESLLNDVGDEETVADAVKRKRGRTRKLSPPIAKTDTCQRGQWMSKQGERSAPSRGRPSKVPPAVVHVTRVKSVKTPSPVEKVDDAWFKSEVLSKAVGRKCQDFELKLRAQAEGALSSRCVSAPDEGQKDILVGDKPALKKMKKYPITVCMGSTVKATSSSSAAGVTSTATISSSTTTVKSAAICVTSDVRGAAGRMKYDVNENKITVQRKKPEPKTKGIILLPGVPVGIKYQILSGKPKLKPDRSHCKQPLPDQIPSQHPYMCKERMCWREFKSNDDLLAHRKDHFPFTCKECERDFRTHKLLENHEKTKTHCNSVRIYRRALSHAQDGSSAEKAKSTDVSQREESCQTFTLAVSSGLSSPRGDILEQCVNEDSYSKGPDKHLSITSCPSSLKPGPSQAQLLASVIGSPQQQASLLAMAGEFGPSAPNLLHPIATSARSDLATPSQEAHDVMDGCHGDVNDESRQPELVMPIPGAHVLSDVLTLENTRGRGETQNNSVDVDDLCGARVDSPLLWKCDSPVQSTSFLSLLLDGPDELDLAAMPGLDNDFPETSSSVAADNTTNISVEYQRLCGVLPASESAASCDVVGQNSSNVDVTKLSET